MYLQDETGYKCPKCGHERSFTASVVLVTFNDVEITPDGWDWYSAQSTECDVLRKGTMRCGVCSYEADAMEFDDCFWQKVRQEEEEVTA